MCELIFDVIFCRHHIMSRSEDLPDDIICDILLRLPVKSIITCKCICKKWKNLVSDSYFVDLHMSRSPECLLIYQCNFISEDSHPGILTLVEIEDELDHTRLLRDPFIGINMADLFPGSLIFLVGSVNGLVCLWEFLWGERDKTHICNPVTREYITLPKHQFISKNYWHPRYGFRISVHGEYKVIRILGYRDTKIEVHTLGTDQWRSIEVPKYFKTMQLYHGIFFKGHVCWIVFDQLLSFDLDNETFQLSPFPPLPDHKILRGLEYLGVLKGCLGLFCKTDYELSIWVMKEHDIEKYWPIENFHNPCTLELDNLFPICLVDGLNGRSILMFNFHTEYDRYQEHDDNQRQLMAHCLETGTCEGTTISNKIFQVKTYRPSLFKLQNFQASAKVHFF